jgi:hypothetical protein
MGTSSSGPLGPANGKIGKLIWYTLKGQQVIRTAGSITAKPSTNQLASRARMAVVMDFFRNMKPYIKAGFSNEAAGTTSSYHNKATSYQLLHSVKTDADLPYLDYSAVKLSIGTVRIPENPAVERVTNGLKFSWTYNVQQEWNSRNDLTMTMAYFPEDQEAVYSLSGSRRLSGSDILGIHSGYDNRIMETYMSFVSEDRSHVSDSIYLGRITPSLTS